MRNRYGNNSMLGSEEKKNQESYSLRNIPSLDFQKKRHISPADFHCHSRCALSSYSFESNFILSNFISPGQLLPSPVTAVLCCLAFSVLFRIVNDCLQCCLAGLPVKCIHLITELLPCSIICHVISSHDILWQPLGYCCL